MPKTPKKAIKPCPNPYDKIKFVYNGTPMNKKKKDYSNTIQTIETGVAGVYISFGTRHDGKCSYLWPFKQYFSEHGDDEDLPKKWGVAGFTTRRLFNEDDPLENVKLPGTPGDEGSYPWDAIITLDSSPKVTALSCGKMIAKKFTAFTEERKDLFHGKKQEFVFKGTLSESESGQPITSYLIDEDAVKVFLQTYYDCPKGNSKEDLLACDQLLEDFFGSADVGRDLLNRHGKW